MSPNTSEDDEMKTYTVIRRHKAMAGAVRYALKADRWRVDSGTPHWDRPPTIEELYAMINLYGTLDAARRESLAERSRTGWITLGAGLVLGTVNGKQDWVDASTLRAYYATT